MAQTSPTSVPPTTLSGAAAPSTTPAWIPFHLWPVMLALSCDAAVTTGSAEAVVSAFRAARLRRVGAEGCLTREALNQYCDRCGPERFHGPSAPSPGPICLYACDGKQVKALNATGARISNGGVTVFLLAGLRQSVEDPSDFVDTEELIFGSGVPATGSRSVPLLIVGAAS